MCYYPARFPGVLRDLLACNEASQLQPLADRALQLVGQLLSPLCSQSKDKAIQLRGLAIGLWNKAVSMKSGGNLVLSLNAQRKQPNYSCASFENKMSILLVAHVVRHIACTTVILSCPDDEVEAFIKKQITVSGSQ